MNSYNNTAQQRFDFTKAFTLLEMLVVVGIVSIILALTTPSILSVLNSFKISQAGDELLSLFSEAQELSNTMGRPVEVRLYEKASPSVAGAGYSVMILEYYQPGENDPRIGGLGQDAGSTLPLATSLAVLSKPVSKLPSGVAMHPDRSLSTLITDPSLAPTAVTSGSAVPIYAKSGVSLVEYTQNQDLPYHAFIYYPNTTNLDSAAGSKWFVTLTAEVDLTKEAAIIRNFYTIQVDPITGRLTRYRP